jgi:hypothetical protein
MMKQQLRDVSNTPTDTGNDDDDDDEKDEKNHHHRQREGARKSTRRGGGGAATTTTTTQHHHHNHQMPSSLNDNTTTTKANTTTGEKRWQVKIISPTDENSSLFSWAVVLEFKFFESILMKKGDFSSNTTAKINHFVSSKRR